VRALSRPEGLGKGSSSPDNVALDYIDRKAETGSGWSTEACGFSSQASRFSGGWLTSLASFLRPGQAPLQALEAFLRFPQVAWIGNGSTADILSAFTTGQLTRVRQRAA